MNKYCPGRLQCKSHLQSPCSFHCKCGNRSWWFQLQQSWWNWTLLWIRLLSFHYQRSLTFPFKSFQIFYHIYMRNLKEHKSNRSMTLNPYCRSRILNGRERPKYEKTVVQINFVRTFHTVKRQDRFLKFWKAKFSKERESLKGDQDFVENWKKKLTSEETMKAMDFLKDAILTFSLEWLNKYIIQCFQNSLAICAQRCI